MKTKIIAAGIGGVGGYFGGLLAKRYEASPEVEICFIARGNHLKQVQQQGLKVIKRDSEFIAKPAFATDNASSLGIADYILVCTKGYDLDTMLEQLKPCVSPNTIILPLLNGVDAVERCAAAFPSSVVLKGCVYLVAHIKEPGIILNEGKIEKLHFGVDGEPNETLLLLEKILKDANVDAHLSNRITEVVWEKFIFLSSIATASSYFNNYYGQMRNDELKYKSLLGLVDEATAIALAKGVIKEKDIAIRIKKQLDTLLPDATSSMHRDFMSGKGKTELESLTGYMVREARRLNVAAPLFDKMYELLKTR